MVEGYDTGHNNHVVKTNDAHIIHAASACLHRTEAGVDDSQKRCHREKSAETQAVQRA
jgi:hypothetical protein